MATATPAPTPNPNALRFALDITLPATISASGPEQADTAFLRAVFAAPGVASVFGVNDFVTITRVAAAPWEPIVAAVTQAAALL
jgi:hypothetical protein